MDVIILHGTGGNPNGNWFPWLKQKLEQKGYNVYIPEFPTPENQSVKSWCDALDKQAPIFGKDTILIGHSCGATYLLHILEVLKEPIKQSIFVSGFLDKLGNPEFDELNKSFVEHDFSWEKIKKNAGKINIFHGEEDPYVPISSAKKLAYHLEKGITLIKNGGHLNISSGYDKFEKLLEVVL